MEHTEEWFDENFTPLKNHLDDNASWDGCMFETYDPELAFVRAYDPSRIWTYADNDYGEPCLVSGYHLVNRIGYILTEESHNGEDIYVALDIEMSDEEDIL